MNSLEILQKRRDEWPLLQKSPEEQKALLKTYLIENIKGVLQRNDYIVQAKILDDIAPVVSEIVAEGVVLEDLFPADQLKDLGPEAVAVTEMVNRQLQMLQIQPEMLANLVVPDMERYGEYPTDMFMIQIVTQQQMEQGVLAQWDQQLGFSASLQGCPLRPNREELRQLFFYTHLMMLMARQRVDPMSSGGSTLLRQG